MSTGMHVTVVGAVNLDISGKSSEPILMGDSNPGRVAVSLGGVGRNIADNLCRLGASVRMVTVLGDDTGAQRAKESCRSLGMDLSLSRVLPGEMTSTYLCIHDADGVMRLAVSDMDILHCLSPVFLQERMEEINKSDLVIMDANLPEESIAFLSEHCTSPLFADPVSAKKAARMKMHVKNITCLKPNRQEAEVLSGISIRGNADLPKAAEVLRMKGASLVFISLGKEGAYYDDGAERGILPCFPGDTVDTTGCGDAFMAAAAYGFLMGRTARGMARMGLAAASLCLEAGGAIRQDLSLPLLESRIHSLGGEEF